MTLTEINPASDRCQRWNDGGHTWRHTSEGGFDPSRYTVEPIDDDTTAKTFVTGHHYSGTYPAAKLRYGLYEQGRQLVGVLVFGIPTSTRALTLPFPDLEPYVESIELSRLVLLDKVPANAESWFIARCFANAAAHGIRGVVSFADPVPRIVDGQVLFPGHVGTIYQASNAILCGRGTARTLTLLPDGTVLSARAMQKVRGQERGHDHVERRLRGHGAPIMLAGEQPAAWLTRALDDVGARKVRHRGNWRYCFPIGTRSQRRHVTLGLPRTDTYPKTPDPIGA